MLLIEEEQPVRIADRIADCPHWRGVRIFPLCDLFHNRNGNRGREVGQQSSDRVHGSRVGREPIARRVERRDRFHRLRRRHSLHITDRERADARDRRGRLTFRVDDDHTVDRQTFRGHLLGESHRHRPCRLEPDDDEYRVRFRIADPAHLAGHPTGVNRLPGRDLRETLPMQFLCQPVEGHRTDRVQPAHREDVHLIALTRGEFTRCSGLASEMIAAVTTAHAPGPGEQNDRNARE